VLARAHTQLPAARLRQQNGHAAPQLGCGTLDFNDSLGWGGLHAIYMAMESLLVISDEPALAETLKSELDDMDIAQARFTESAAQAAGDYRLVVIDEGGAADNLQETVKMPVIRLKRPVILRELLYTIRERLQGKNLGAREELPLGPDLRFCAPLRLIRSEKGDLRIPLTEKEAELLQCLLEAAGKTVSRDMLLKGVWGYSDDIATHTLETHIYRLRGKLRQASESLDIISSDEGGYQLKLV
jgi:DNA-binding response OmpR family regulator